jgi:hypothetical protein
MLVSVAMRQKLFTLCRSDHEYMWRRFKQTNDRHIVERLHAILLPGISQNVDANETGHCLS